MHAYTTPSVLVFAVVALAAIAVGVFYASKAITHTVARAWFAEKERHAKRIIQLSKED